MSPEFTRMVKEMIREMSGCRYCYRIYINGLYEKLVTRCRYVLPVEGQAACVDYVLEFFKKGNCDDKKKVNSVTH